MFSSEDGAFDTVKDSVREYEDYFGTEFPLYEHVNITKNEEFDFSKAGALRLKEFIGNLIASNTEVEIPNGYEDRKY